MEGQFSPEKEFWGDAIAAVKAANPSFVVIGETYGEDVQRRLLDLGFDYVYDKDTYDCLVNRDLDGFRRQLAKFDDLTKSRLLHFTENHDELRAIAAFGGDPRVASAAAAILLTLPGVRLINHGQWEGFRASLDVHLRRALPDPGDGSSREFYDRPLFELLKSAPLGVGHWVESRVVGAWSVVASTWTTSEEGVVVVVNFSEGKATGHVILSVLPDVDLRLSDFVTGEHIALDEGIPVELNPWEVRVFRF